MASTHLLCTGKIVGGEIDWNISPLTAEDSADDEMYGSEDYPEACLVEDEAEMTADYEDYLADVEWLRGGC